MTIEVPGEFVAFVQQRVASGIYASESEVVRAAFDLLEKRERLLEKIDAGVAQLAAGEFTEYDANSRARFLADVTDESERLRNQKPT